MSDHTRLVALLVAFVVTPAGASCERKANQPVGGRVAGAAGTDPQIQTADQARAFVVGTWTGIKLRYDDKSDGTINWWGKLVLKPDGTYELYQAKPTDKKWDPWAIGKGKWEVVSYPSSGEPTKFAVEVKPNDYSPGRAGIHEWIGTLLLEGDKLRAFPPAWSSINKQYSLRHFTKEDASGFPG